MPTFVIERQIPAVGGSTPEELRLISQQSNGVLEEMGPTIQWVHSYVTPDKIYCVYEAESAEQVREHARRGGFPADSVAQVQEVIDPGTGRD